MKGFGKTELIVGSSPSRRILTTDARLAPSCGRLFKRRFSYVQVGDIVTQILKGEKRDANRHVFHRITRCRGTEINRHQVDAALRFAFTAFLTPCVW